MGEEARIHLLLALVVWPLTTRPLQDGGGDTKRSMWHVLYSLASLGSRFFLDTSGGAKESQLLSRCTRVRRFRDRQTVKVSSSWQWEDIE